MSRGAAASSGAFINRPSSTHTSELPVGRLQWAATATPPENVSAPTMRFPSRRSRSAAGPHSMEPGSPTPPTHRVAVPVGSVAYTRPSTTKVISAVAAAGVAPIPSHGPAGSDATSPAGGGASAVVVVVGWVVEGVAVGTGAAVVVVATVPAVVVEAVVEVVGAVPVPVHDPTKRAQAATARGVRRIRDPSDDV